MKQKPTQDKKLRCVAPWRNARDRFLDRSVAVIGDCLDEEPRAAYERGII